MVDVCVVIVTVNHVAFIKPCIESILIQEGSLSIKLVIVDDGSTDGTRKIIENYGDNIELIYRDGGHSFANNNNLVLNKEGAKYFLLLNPDTILLRNVIADLYYFMDSHPKIGVCGPRLEYPDGSLQFSCRRFPTPSTVLWRRTPLRRFLPERKRGKTHLMMDSGHDKICQVDWLLAACLIINGEAIKQVGYFDERFRLYCEDIDLCYRLWQKGWSVYYNPEVMVIHDHQAISDKKMFSKFTFWHYTSMFKYFVKHGFSGFKRPMEINR